MGPTSYCHHIKNMLYYLWCDRRSVRYSNMRPPEARAQQVQHTAGQYSTVQYSTAQHSTVQYRYAVQYRYLQIIAEYCVQRVAQSIHCCKHTVPGVRTFTFVTLFTYQSVVLLCCTVQYTLYDILCITDISTTARTAQAFQKDDFDWLQQRDLRARQHTVLL